MYTIVNVFISTEFNIRVLSFYGSVVSTQRIYTAFSSSYSYSYQIIVINLVLDNKILVFVYYLCFLSLFLTLSLFHL